MTVGLGDQVRLRACHDSGQPGTVIKAERGKLVVFWPDFDFWSKHHPDSLELAEPGNAPQPLPASLARYLECEENTHNEQ